MCWAKLPPDILTKASKNSIFTPPYVLKKELLPSLGKEAGKSKQAELILFHVYKISILELAVFYGFNDSSLDGIAVFI